MAQIFEFFFNLLLTIWSHIEQISEPIFNFLSGSIEFIINSITKALEWFLDSLEWIVDLFKKIGEFFGVSDPGPWGGGGGRPR